MRFDENDYSILKEASEITGTDYNIIWLDRDEFKGYIDTDSLLSCIEDLTSEVSRLNEKIEDLEQDIQDNYRPISKAEQYEVSERDFI